SDVVRQRLICQGGRVPVRVICQRRGRSFAGEICPRNWAKSRRRVADGGRGQAVRVVVTVGDRRPPPVREPSAITVLPRRRRGTAATGVAEVVSQKVPRYRRLR